MATLSPSPCPAREVLEHFRRGVLPDAELERLADHIANCSLCSTLLAAASNDDKMLATLRHSLKQAPLPEEDACAAVAKKVREWSDSSSSSGGKSRRKIPARIGPFEILARISSGGMGDVYKARDPR